MTRGIVRSVHSPNPGGSGVELSEGGSGRRAAADRPVHRFNAAAVDCRTPWRWGGMVQIVRLSDSSRRLIGAVPARRR